MLMPSTMPYISPAAAHMAAGWPEHYAAPHMLEVADPVAFLHEASPARQCRALVDLEASGLGAGPIFSADADFDDLLFGGVVC